MARPKSKTFNPIPTSSPYKDIDEVLDQTHSVDGLHCPVIIDNTVRDGFCHWVHISDSRANYDGNVVYYHQQPIDYWEASNGIHRMNQGHIVLIVNSDELVKYIEKYSFTKTAIR